MQAWSLSSKAFLVIHLGTNVCTHTQHSTHTAIWVPAELTDTAAIDHGVACACDKCDCIMYADVMPMIKSISQGFKEPICQWANVPRRRRGKGPRRQRAKEPKGHGDNGPINQLVNGPNMAMGQRAGGS